MEDLYRPCIDDQLELVCCFNLDLGDENAVSNLSRAFGCCMLFLVHGSTFRPISHYQFDIFICLEHSREDLYDPCINDLALHSLLKLVYYLIGERFRGAGRQRGLLGRRGSLRGALNVLTVPLVGLG